MNLFVLFIVFALVHSQNCTNAQSLLMNRINQCNSLSSGLYTTAAQNLRCNCIQGNVSAGTSPNCDGIAATLPIQCVVEITLGGIANPRSTVYQGPTCTICTTGAISSNIWPAACTRSFSQFAVCEVNSIPTALGGGSAIATIQSACQCIGAFYNSFVSCGIAGLTTELLQSSVCKAEWNFCACDGSNNLARLGSAIVAFLRNQLRVSLEIYVTTQLPGVTITISITPTLCLDRFVININNGTTTNIALRSAIEKYLGITGLKRIRVGAGMQDGPSSSVCTTIVEINNKRDEEASVYTVQVLNVASPLTLSVTSMLLLLVMLLF